MAAAKDLNRMMFRLCLQLLLLRLQICFQKSSKEDQRECIRGMVCLKEVLPTGFGNIFSVIYSPEKNASFHFHRLGKLFGIYLEATSCESKKKLIELNVAAIWESVYPASRVSFDLPR